MFRSDGVSPNRLLSTLGENKPDLQAESKNRIADMDSAALCEHVLSQVAHPDISAIKNATRAALPDLTYSDHLERSLDQFKSQNEYRALAREMPQVIRALSDLFPVNSESQTIHNALEQLIERSGLTGLSSTRSDSFGKQTLNVLELTCLRLKQLQHLSNFFRLNPGKVPTGRNYPETLQDAIRNIAAEATYCAPGLVQKTEDEFSEVKLRLFPPALKETVHTVRERISRQVIREFCDTTYSNETTYNNSEVHYVAAWQNKIRIANPNYAFMPEVDDVYAPRLPNNTATENRLARLTKKLDTHANLSKVFLNLGVDILNELRTTLGDRCSDFSKNYSSFKDALRAMATRYEAVKESDFIDFESDGITPRLTNNPDLLAIRLASNFKGELFNTTEVANTNNPVVYEHDSFYWTGSAKPNDGGLIARVSLENLGDEFLTEVLSHSETQAHPRTELLLEAIQNADTESLKNFSNSDVARRFGLDTLSEVNPECLKDRTDIAHVLAMTLLTYGSGETDQATTTNRFGFSRSTCLKRMALKKTPLSFYNPHAVKALVTELAKQGEDCWAPIGTATGWNNAELMDALLLELTSTGRVSVKEPRLFQQAARDAGDNHKMSTLAAFYKHLGLLNAETIRYGYIIHRLIQHDDSHGVQYILEHGANPDLKMSRRYAHTSALHMAIDLNRKNMVQALIKHNVNLQETWKGPTNNTMTPLLFAELSGKTQIAEMLRAAGAGYPTNKATIDDPITRAVEGGDLKTAARLLHETGQINKPFHKGKTILHLAAIKGDIEAMRYAVHNGAYLEAKSSGWTSSKTPLIHAIKHGNVDTVEALLSWGADRFATVNSLPSADYADAINQVQIANIIRNYQA